MEDQDKRTELIMKLLAKAQGAATEAEAAAYNDKATTLMIQWGIEEATLAQGVAPKDGEIIRKNLDVTCPAAYSFELVTMGCKIARLGFGMVGLIGSGHGSKKHLIVIGYTGDVDRFELLYRSLEQQAMHELEKWWKISSHRWSNGTDKYNQRKSFLASFALRVALRIRETRATAVAESTTPGTELALVDRSKKVTAWANENMQIAFGRGRHYRGDAGMIAGAIAGNRANIGGGSRGIGQ